MLGVQVIPSPCEPVKSGRVQRCLFGSPDPVDTQTLIDEQFLRDREHMLSEWGFDILTGLPSDSSGRRVKSWELVSVAEESTRPVGKEAQVRPTPYARQTRISDFWRARRSSSTVKSGNAPQQPLVRSTSVAGNMA